MLFCCPSALGASASSSCDVRVVFVFQKNMALFDTQFWRIFSQYINFCLILFSFTTLKVLFTALPLHLAFSSMFKVTHDVFVYLIFFLKFFSHVTWIIIHSRMPTSISFSFLFNSPLRRPFQCLTACRRQAQTQAEQNPSKENGKQARSPASNQNVISNGYVLGQFLQRSDTGYINHSPGQTSRWGAVGQCKSDLCFGCVHTRLVFK